MIHSARVTSMAFAFVAALTVAPGRAAVIAYTEPPDLSTIDFSPTALGNLGIGTNTVTGTINSALAVSGDRVDSFSMSLPAGLRITGVNAAISLFSVTNNTMFGQFVSGFSGGLIPFLGTFTGNGLVTGFSGATGGPGALNLIMAGDTSNSDKTLLGNSLNYSYSYVVSVAVEAIPTAPSVPEPTTLALLGLGFAGLGFARRRRDWASDRR